jgi:hypothetical protein
MFGILTNTSDKPNAKRQIKNLSEQFALKADLSGLSIADCLNSPTLIDIFKEFDAIHKNNRDIVKQFVESFSIKDVDKQNVSVEFFIDLS